jgi:hypothetical protein
MRWNLPILLYQAVLSNILSSFGVGNEKSTLGPEFG